MNQWKRKSLLVISMFLAVSLTTACGTGKQEVTDTQEEVIEETQEPTAVANENTEVEPDADWTVMIYMTGANEYEDEPMATQALSEIAEAKANEHVNIVVETGACPAWYSEEYLDFEIATDKLQRYALEDGTYVLKEEEPIKSMGVASTLSEFIKWGSENYPAKKYMLFVYAHGGGSLEGFIFDPLFNNDALTLEEFESALRMGGTKFEAVYMQTCLMATFETAQAIAPYVNYYLSSEEVSYALDYKSSIQYLYDNPSVNGANFGKRVSDAYLVKYAQYNQESGQFAGNTFSVIDESKIDAVTVAFNEAIEQLRHLISENPDAFRSFCMLAANAEHYYYPQMVDLLDLVEKTRGYGLDSTYTNNLVNAIRDAVVYQVKGSNHPYAGGLSFYYYPTSNLGNLERYARVSKNASYLALLDQINYAWTAPAWVYEEVEWLPDMPWENYHVQVEIVEGENGRPELQYVHGSTAIAAIDGGLELYDEENEKWIDLGTDGDYDSEFEDEVFKDNFDGTWASIDGVLCMMYATDEAEDYIIYDIPVSLSDETDSESHADRFLRVKYTYEDKEYEVLGIGAKPIIELGVPERNISYLEDETVQAKLLAVCSDGGYTTLGTITISDEMQIERMELPSGRYKYSFVVSDLFKNTVEESIELEWNGEEAVFQFE